MQISPKIFRAYDVRGVYPDELNEDIAYKIGAAFVSFLSYPSPRKLGEGLQATTSKLKIVIGRDCRVSAPKIFKSFSQGVIEQGTDVIDIGLVSTDTCYFALNHLKIDGAAVITASHNPPEYIGIKMVARGPKFICSDWGIPQIKELVLKNKILKAKEEGKITRKNIISDYVKHILQIFTSYKFHTYKICKTDYKKPIQKLKKLRTVIDASNGMGGKVIQELAKKVPIKLFPLYFTPDGRFPNHLPNPLIEENIKELRQKVVKNKAHFGLALDGDGDRTIFVDEKGEVISGDMIIALFGLDYLKKEPGSNIVYNLTCSKSVPEIIKENGGNPIKTRTGHAFMKEAAKKNKAVFGGEISGHLYFRDVFYGECTGLSLLLMLKILSETNQPLSDLIKKFKRYYRIGEVNFEVEDRPGKIKELEERFADGKVDRLDGLTVEYKDWWFNARPSNTEPLLRLVIEAKTKDAAEKRLKELSAIIQKEQI